MSGETPWLDLALSELGIREIAGSRHNKKIVSYFSDVGRPDIENDETAWCAAAQGSWLKRSGYPLPNVESSLMLLARSYINYGVPCSPKIGAIGIWPRGSIGWQGHVGTIVKVGRTTVDIVAGNQDNSVSIATYPINTALAFRWPVKAELPALREVGVKEVRDADIVETVGYTGTFWTAVSSALSGMDHLYGMVQRRPWIVFILVLSVLLIVVARRWKDRILKSAESGVIES